MRQNTLPVIQSQVRTQMPPDHAGVERDDGNARARMCCSSWAAVYQWEA